MDEEQNEIDLYRDILHYFHDILHAQLNSDDYIRKIIKGDDLHPLDAELRGFVQEQLLEQEPPA